MSTETLVGEAQSVVLEVDELEYQEEPHDYAKFGIFCQSNCH